MSDLTRPCAGACPDCGTPFVCGAASGCDGCWCAALPRVVPVPAGPSSDAGAACVCHSCLFRKIEQFQAVAPATRQQ